MASRFSANDVLDLFFDEDDGLPDEEESDFEGEGVYGYLPEVTASRCCDDDRGEDSGQDAQHEDAEEVGPSPGEDQMGLATGKSTLLEARNVI